MADQVKPEASASNTQTRENAAVGPAQSNIGAGSSAAGQDFATTWLKGQPNPPSAESFRAIGVMPPQQRDAIILELHGRFGNKYVSEQLAANSVEPGANGSVSKEIGGKRQAESGWDAIGGTFLGPVGAGALVGAAVDQVRARGTRVQKDVLASIEKSYAYAPDVYQAIWKDFRSTIKTTLQ